MTGDPVEESVDAGAFKLEVGVVVIVGETVSDSGEERGRDRGIVRTDTAVQ